MLEPRLLGLMPDPTSGDELLAAKAEKPPLLAAAEEEPDEEGTELNGDDLELKEAKVGWCGRVALELVSLLGFQRFWVELSER